MKTFIVNKNYRVFFLNHGYYAQEQFATFTEALSYAKSKGFEASIHDGVDRMLAFWGPIGGLKSDLGYRDITGV